LGREQMRCSVTFFLGQCLGRQLWDLYHEVFNLSSERGGMPAVSRSSWTALL
jgi:hypothetical protein